MREDEIWGKIIALIESLGGQGGEPAQYLKSIEKDQATHTITITDKAGTETSFEYGGGISDKLVHEYLYTNGDTSLNGTSNEGI